MLQNAPIGALHKRVRAYAEHHIHLIFRDFDPLHQGTNDLPAGRPICPGEPVPHLHHKCLQSPDNEA